MSVLPEGLPAPVPTDGREPINWRGYAIATALCLLTSLLSTVLLMDVFEPANIVMLFLLTVVVVAMRHGRGPASLGGEALAQRRKAFLRAAKLHARREQLQRAGESREALPLASHLPLHALG